MDAPFEAMVDVGKDSEQGLVPPAMGLDQLLPAARNRPGCLDPALRHMSGENVEHAAIADRIADHVPVGTEPAEIFAALELDRRARPDPGGDALHRPHGA